MNIQGDEPLIAPPSIDLAAQELQDHPEAAIGTLISPCSEEEYRSPTVVKVVMDARQGALYFSRAPIPHRRSGQGEFPRWKHVGLYAYRRLFLLDFAQMPPGVLEQIESLEQLRALEAGFRIACAVTPYPSLGVDTPEDVALVEEALAKERSR